MSKIYIYRGKNDNATIYYNKEFPESKGVPVFEYDGEIPSGIGTLKTDGVSLYYEEPMLETALAEPITEAEQMRADIDYIAVMTGVEL